MAWVTLGSHHIPRTEDLPIVTTPTMEVSFTLSPFNYFPEDPAMTSDASVLIEPRVRSQPNLGLKVVHSKDKNDKCSTSDSNKFLSIINEKTSHMFDV